MTTYQTGKLDLRPSHAEGLNTHFRNFTCPMGMAWKAPKLAVGTRSQVWEYRKQFPPCRRSSSPHPSRTTPA